MNMKKIVILVLVILGAVATATCGQNNSINKDQIFNSKTILIDVRTPSEYAYDHLKKAVNIPLNKIEEDIKYFAPDKEQTIVVYCSSGKRAAVAAKELKNMGYKNVINAGRLKDLKPLEERLSKSNQGK